MLMLMREWEQHKTNKWVHSYAYAYAYAYVAGVLTCLCLCYACAYAYALVRTRETVHSLVSFNIANYGFYKDMTYKCD